MNKKISAWYSFVSGDEYPQDDFFFFDVSDKDWVELLEKNHQKILEEINNLIYNKDKNIVPYYNKTLASESEKWTVFPLYIWGMKKFKNCTKCPQTVKLVESVTGMTSASFSILKANSNIKPHLGDTNVMYRCHLGLQIPAQLPHCGIKAGNENRDWENGKILSFCDAQRHTVWNDTNHDRLVLIIDVLRPEFIHEKNWICAKILGTFFWQFFFQNYYIIRHFPIWLRKMIMQVTQFFTMIFLKTNNFLGNFFSKK